MHIYYFMKTHHGDLLKQLQLDAKTGFVKTMTKFDKSRNFFLLLGALEALGA